MNRTESMTIAHGCRCQWARRHLSLYLKFDAATIDLGYRRSRDDLSADRRCRQMKHVDACSHGTLPRSKDPQDS
jgi:hypothetical protein